MATSKTGSFWLTETVTMAGGTAANTEVNGTVDLGAYVDVGDQQAIAIEQVDFITQYQDPAISDSWTSYGASFLTANGCIDIQLTDLNPQGLLVRADDNTLIASGALNIDDANNIVSQSDFFPDTFGKLDESRMVVNDQLYVVARNSGAQAGGVPADSLAMTVRVKARIVKLSTKDWIAIAVQSTAADN